MDALIEKRIVQDGDEWCVHSEKGKNLGCGPSKDWAESRLREVEYFKHKKSLTEEEIWVRLEDKSLVVSAAILKSWWAVREAQINFKALFNVQELRAAGEAIVEREGKTAEEILEENKHLPGKHDQQSHAGNRDTHTEYMENEVKLRELKDRAKSYEADSDRYLKQGKRRQSSTYYDLADKVKREAEKLKTRQKELAKSGLSSHPEWGKFKRVEGEGEGDTYKAPSGATVYAYHRGAWTMQRVAAHSYIESAGGKKEWFGDTARDQANKFLAEAFGIGVVEKHGVHDQQSHGNRGSKGTGYQVANTPSQLTNAAARQLAKDEGVSVRQAKKKLGGMKKLPTTKVPAFREKKYKPIPVDLSEYIKKQGHDPMEIPAEWDTMDEKRMKLYPITREVLKWRKEQNKSLVTKADQSCLKALWEQYAKYYSGKYIGAAWQAFQAKNYPMAAAAFAKARDGFEPKKNPKEYNCLDGWRQEAESKQGEQKHLPGQHEQASHGGNGVAGEEDYSDSFDLKRVTSALSKRDKFDRAFALHHLSDKELDAAIEFAELHDDENGLDAAKSALAARKKAKSQVELIANIVKEVIEPS